MHTLLRGRKYTSDYARLTLPNRLPVWLTTREGVLYVLTCCLLLLTGNIMLNIMLSSSMPMSRQGKNNVTLICVPNPPLDGSDDNKPVSMLIKVKTGDDADELLQKLEEAKKTS